jgi:hypothetical protein
MSTGVKDEVMRTEAQQECNHDQCACKAQQLLKATKRQQLSRLSCVERDGALYVSGTVTTYYLKQLALQALLPLGCTLQLEELVVIPDQS